MGEGARSWCVMNETDLLELCKYIVEIGVKKGADAVEVQATLGKEIKSDIEMGQIRAVNSSDAAEIGIRAFVDKKMGAAFTNIATKESGVEALEMAFSASRASTPDEDWVSLPMPSKDYPDLKKFWQDDVAQSRPSKVVDLSLRLLELGSSAEAGMIPAGGGSAAISVISAYANSNGTETSFRTTVAYVVLAAVAQTETGMTPGVVSLDIKRHLDLELESTVQRVARIIRICKTAAKGRTGKFTVVLHPRAYSQIFQYTFIQSVRGDNVARGKSKIGDKIGEKIASDLLTVVDDGLHPRGLRSSSADDEGVPRRRTPIIESGILRSFIWDTYWGNKMGVKSTGNARRRMRQGLVEIAPSTFVVSPGERSIEEIISEMDYGYYIENVQGAHSANPESGDFSIVGNPALLIENGKLMGAVHGLMVSGNAFELLKQVREIAKEPIYLTGTIGPEIVLDGVNIISKDE
ncbi:MAG: TldD/PmbA family protein [Candidatus Thorarchaeota archaeon]|nr:TldD/PmbA family protein [Candidatus Thorarchaeota archaeon]